ncbi:hypothetical protein [Microbacterium sp. SLBN-146]|uniref:hypothetical protein n=1 Tax=Microbacterium sp. SLBN-146 TaxID=2768457 RepID=UPI0011518E87|nr:hypothetical protein [Microbacterium sp. SLBN-146]TQJ29566.1 hypothetical protein FBY39_0008 [Microbacterium sp. SLBN-146]
MKAWVVRFVSLYLFNVVVLLVMGWIVPGVAVGWAAFWAAILLTAATIWLKPVIKKAFAGAAAKSAGQRTRAGEWLVQAVLVFLVELIIWIAVVLLSGVSVRGWFWGWVLPPIALLIAWAIYAAVDDRIEARAGAVYDRATGGRATDAAAARPEVRSTRAGETGRRELKDGLTDEQRRMLDEL